MKHHPWTLEPELTRREKALGLAYLPFHVLGLPQLLGALATAHPELTTATANLILYGVGMVFLALAFGKRLFAHYNLWVDNAGRVLLTLGKSFLLFMALTVVLAVILPVLQMESLTNPNNEMLMNLSGADFRVTFALAIFIAPILEETLFRGVLFGALRGKSAPAAYGVSCLAFALAHLWQYAALGPQVWLLVLQYLPVSIALCYAYEKTGCLWTPILVHMMNNMLAYNMLK